MSKGLGKQQKRILEELKRRPAFYLAELAHNRTDNVSLNRAAWKLFDAGLIEVDRYFCGREKILVRRHGVHIDRIKYERHEYEWQTSKITSVEQVTGHHPFNTYGKEGGDA